MKIYGIAENQLNVLKQQNKYSKQNFSKNSINQNNIIANSPKLMANYNKAAISFGSKKRFITYGVGEIVLELSQIGKKATSVAVELLNKAQNVETPEISTLQSVKRDISGNFYLPIVSVNRKNNEYLENIQVNAVKFFDVDGSELKVEKSKVSLSPQKEFSKTAQRKLALNGNERFADISVISTANTKSLMQSFDNYEDVKNYKGKTPLFAILNSKKACDSFIIDTTEEDFILPVNIKGILIPKPKMGGNGKFFLDCLSHAKARIEGKQALAMVEEEVFETIKATYPSGTPVKVVASTNGLDIQEIDKIAETNNKVNLAPIKLNKGVLEAKDRGFVPEAVGIKAYNLGKLQEISKIGGFSVPNHVALPAGFFEDIKMSNPNIYNKEGLYQAFCDVVDKAYYDDVSIDVPLQGMRKLIEKDMVVPENMVKQLSKKIKKVFGRDLAKIETIEDLAKQNNKKSLMLSVRSSFPNFEDLDIVSTQGMFDSVGGVKTTDELLKAIKKVWASKWGQVATQKRFEHGIAHDSVQPAVLVQEFVKDVDYIFTAYTRKVDDPDTILIDLSQGLTSNMQGDPYLFEINRKTGAIRRTLMATKGRKKSAEHIDLNDKANLKYSKVDYSTDPFNLSHDEYAPIIKKLSDIFMFVEKHFDNKAQDIEGGIKFIRDDNGKIIDVKTTLWQTRDVQMPHTN